jgi:carbonic anhydrase
MTASEELVRRAKNSLFATSPRPSKRLAVVTCMDGRIDPLRILAMGLGDIHMIRNAGGIVTEDVLRSLLISQRMLGTREVLIFMHTDCGLAQVDDKRERAAAEAELGQRIPFEFGGFTDLEARVRASVPGGPDLSLLAAPRSDHWWRLRRRVGGPASPSLTDSSSLLPSEFDL